MSATPLCSLVDDFARNTPLADSPQRHSRFLISPPRSNEKRKLVRTESVQLDEVFKKACVRKLVFTDEKAVNIDLRAIGKRSHKMLQLLQKLPGYNENCFVFEGASYAVLTGNFQAFAQPFVSCGSDINREFILVDFKNSESLQTHFKQLQKRIIDLKNSQNNMMSHFNIFNVIVDYVRKDVFCLLQGQKVDQLVAAFVADGTHKSIVNCEGVSIPVIAIDEFIDKKIGVCRHHAIVVALFLHQLTLTTDATALPLLNGTVQHIRMNTIAGAHAWASFVCKDEIWIIDSAMNIIVECNQAESSSLLSLRYGQAAINSFFARTQVAYRLFNAEKFV